MAILAACERLSEQGVAVTPGGADQLLTTRVAGAVLRRWKKEMGGSTREFRDSVESFQNFADSRRDGSHVKLCHVDVSRNKFTCICLFPGFFKALKALCQAGRVVYHHHLRLDASLVSSWVGVWLRGCRVV